MKWIVRIALLFACCYGQLASAEDYNWRYAGQSYPSADAACQAHLDVMKAMNSAYVDFRVELTNPSSGKCVLLSKNGTSLGSAIIGRQGDGCTDGTYDNTINGCVPNPEPNLCESTVGSIINHEHKLKDSVHGSDRVEPPGSVCANSCTYTFQYIVNNIYVYSSGTPSGVFGSYQYRGNGFECSGDDYNAPGNPGGTTDPDETPPPDPDNNCPSGYVWNGTFCSKEPPKPCDPEVEVGGCGETPTDPEPGDGGDDGEGGEDGDDGDGDGGSGGDGSGGDGSGGDGSGGDGSGGDGSGGDGSGDGDGKDDEEKPDSSVGGESCDSTLSCEGDAVQCAILRKQKEQLCAWDYSKSKADIEQAVQGPAYQLAESTVNLASSFNDGANASRWLSSGCPSPKTFSVRGVSYSITWQPVCDYASALSNLIVALAGIFFAVYVGRGLGGS
ncbi:virulence factor TspB C-terminal domain-related protein [Stutzerimonas nitrititolerans]|uniref:virulence factor TspB C-terminal domain-related protein n=1 Tax=Stutzerimonas nitrititolerans TaxID=2482751 RepID=UPI00289D878B|nr:virulence factor TspB C-terminal domain-related protein [Stutzerimonas nitrititolerans]